MFSIIVSGTLAHEFSQKDTMNHYPQADSETALFLQIRDLSQDSVDKRGERERLREMVCVSL